MGSSSSSRKEGLQPSAAPYGGGRGDESENKNRNPKPQRITESPCHCNFGGTCAATSRNYVNFVRLHSGKWQGGRNQEGERARGVAWVDEGADGAGFEGILFGRFPLNLDLNLKP